jgi:L-lysine 2,3-aminomutase
LKRELMSVKNTLEHVIRYNRNHRLHRPFVTFPSMPRPRYVTKLQQLTDLPEDARDELAQTCDRFPLRTNTYYLSLINWNDPDDPIRRVIIPRKEELQDWGKLDASNESLYTKAHGLEHKYSDTAVLLVTDVCGGYCRFCFRKRLFMKNNNEVSRDVSEGLEYISRHRNLTNVLLTGGDPLILSTDRLEKIISQLREIDHIRHSIHTVF